MIRMPPYRAIESMGLEKSRAAIRAGASSAAPNRSERNVILPKRRRVFAVGPVELSRALVRLVVLAFLFLPRAAGFFGAGGQGRPVAGGEAVLPLFAFQVVVLGAGVELVKLAVLRLVRVPLGLGPITGAVERVVRIVLVPILVILVGSVALFAVVVVPAGVGGMSGVGGENVEREAGAAAVG